MKAELSVRQRILIGSVLAVAFLLVLGSNLLDRKHFETIQKSVNSIYHDRILVQDYIYRLRNHIYIEELSLVKEVGVEEPNSIEQQVRPILNDYKNTVLTPEERKLLDRLIDGYASLEALEIKIRTNYENQDVYIETKEILAQIKNHLDALETIQIVESGRLTKVSEKSLGMNMMLSNLEVIFLVLIGISMLLLAFQPVKTLELVHRN